MNAPVVGLELGKSYHYQLLKVDKEWMLTVLDLHDQVVGIYKSESFHAITEYIRGFEQ